MVTTKYNCVVLLLLLGQVWNINAKLKDEHSDDDSTPIRSDTVGQQHEHLYVVTEKKRPNKKAAQNKPKEVHRIGQEFKSLLLDLGKESFYKCLGHSNQILNPSTFITLENNDTFKYCLLKEKWLKELPESYSLNNVTRRSEPLRSKYIENLDDRFNFVRPVDPACKEFEDCLHKTRNFVRPFPGKCYNHTYAPDKQNEFWQWWRTAYGDILYTFDFVMYDDIHAERKENQFWYLMAYLRYIARAKTNPIDFVIGIKRGYDDYKHKFKELDNRIESLELISELFT